VYAGPGVVLDFVKPDGGSNKLGDTYFKIQYGVGIEYFLSKKLGLKIFGEHNLVFSDELDGIVNGKRDDFYYNLGVGVNYYFKL